MSSFLFLSLAHTPPVAPLPYKMQRTLMLLALLATGVVMALPECTRERSYHTACEENKDRYVCIVQGRRDDPDRPLTGSWILLPCDINAKCGSYRSRQGVCISEITGLVVRESEFSRQIMKNMNEMKAQERKIE